MDTLILANAMLFLSTLSLRRATTSDKSKKSKTEFLSTLSLRRATQILDDMSGATGHFYPRSPCGERQYLVRGQRPNWGISIHALLAESDVDTPVCKLSKSGISIHALLAESDPVTRPGRNLSKFLSTLSLRRATQILDDMSGATGHFYPRSPCGERPPQWTIWIRQQRISIHALLAESDHYDNYNLHCVEISIHALLAESDPG